MPKTLKNNDPLHQYTPNQNTPNQHPSSQNIPSHNPGFFHPTLVIVIPADAFLPVSTTQTQTQAPQQNQNIAPFVSVHMP